MLDDTLVVWAGEFGRTVYAQGALQKTTDAIITGRCFSAWLAGGGVRPGPGVRRDRRLRLQRGREPVHIHDLNATILHCWASTTRG